MAVFGIEYGCFDDAITAPQTDHFDLASHWHALNRFDAHPHYCVRQRPVGA